MKIGITLPNFEPQATRENILRLAVDAEKEGLDSLWVGERLLWPLISIIQFACRNKALLICHVSCTL